MRTPTWRLISFYGTQMRPCLVKTFQIIYNLRERGADVYRSRKILGIGGGLRWLIRDRRNELPLFVFDDVFIANSPLP